MDLARPPQPANDSLIEWLLSEGGQKSGWLGNQEDQARAMVEVVAGMLVFVSESTRRLRSTILDLAPKTTWAPTNRLGHALCKPYQNKIQY